MMSVLPKLQPRPINEALEHVRRLSGSAISREEAAIEIERHRPDIGMKARGLVEKDRSAALFKDRRFDEAIEAYKRAIRMLLLKDAEYILPHKEAVITDVENTPTEEFNDIVACANNIAQAAVMTKEYSLALEWVIEVFDLYDSHVRLHKRPAFAWRDGFAPYEEHYTSKVKAHLRHAIVFRALGNTAAAYATIFKARSMDNLFISMGQSALPRNIQPLRDQCDDTPYRTKRHPEPADMANIDITDPSLQVRGSWRKLRVNGKKPSPRLARAGFIWKSRMYIIGYQDSTPPLRGVNNAWILDLNNLEAENAWRPLPIPASAENMWASRAAVKGDKAYLFHGDPTLHVLDLKSETWSELKTTPEDGTPWLTFYPPPGNHSHSFTVNIIGDTLFVFGGHGGDNEVGRNAFLALDLQTRKWRRISGHMLLDDNINLPGARRHAASWTVGDKIHVALGCAGLTAPGMPDRYGGDYAYEDQWSYDATSKTWCQEKWAGNTPGARTEVAYTFNNVWNRAIIFGGCSPTLCWTVDDPNDPRTSQYSYFADTFVWNPDTGRWSQVISRGFPTYRAQSCLMTDQDTGRTYLFGGYAHPEYTPIKKSSKQPSGFNDVWELCIDVPGGGFREEDFVVDASTSVLGPWRPCFNCEGVGRWPVCAGSCKMTGTPAAFCGPECQRLAWKEHKRLNGCRNVKENVAV